MKLSGRIVQIAGSCHRDTATDLVGYAHTVVRHLVQRILAAGGRILAGVGDEPMTCTDPNLSNVFYWTILETVAERIANGAVAAHGACGPVVAVVATSASEKKIPTTRRSLWDRMLSDGAVLLQYLQPGWWAGGVQRTNEASLGDVLITIGGAQGVEHLAQLYTAEGKPVIPLDLPVRGSTGSTLLGSPRLAAEAASYPEEFLRLAPGCGAAPFSGISTRGGQSSPEQVSDRVLRLIEFSVAPTAFYVRLLDRAAADFDAVEAYFRKVVDPFVVEAGYVPQEMGVTAHRYTWVNEAIFKLIQASGLVVTDLTGLRPNCALELGFAFGRRKRVLLIARSGTALPFDLRPYECHMWSDPDDSGEGPALRAYAERNAYRLPP